MSYTVLLTIIAWPQIWQNL